MTPAIRKRLNAWTAIDMAIKEGIRKGKPITAEALAKRALYHGKPCAVTREEVEELVGLTPSEVVSTGAKAKGHYYWEDEGHDETRHRAGAGGR